jgi:hypothetical protein
MSSSSSLNFFNLTHPSSLLLHNVNLVLSHQIIRNQPNIMHFQALSFAAVIALCSTGVAAIAVPCTITDEAVKRLEISISKTAVTNTQEIHLADEQYDPKDLGLQAEVKAPEAEQGVTVKRREDSSVANPAAIVGTPSE